MPKKVYEGNDTRDCFFRKFCVDLPVYQDDYLNKVTARSRFNGNRGQYLRMLIDRDIEQNREEQIELFDQYRDPMKRYDGFKGKMASNPFFLSWLKRRAEKKVEKTLANEIG